ncbi:serine/threonine-protein kinase mtor [Anaeramoeba ignava]|uniref:Serine/threonine-protein kinase TOR n=1 Tax=Anaeramoeba ignava TaxID=1746090 RepID=A0A9Q0LRS7_ANAIG|nr:serine/threonine-protein kinase mtor [Anaeramoeba ignava]
MDSNEEILRFIEDIRTANGNKQKESLTKLRSHLEEQISQLNRAESRILMSNLNKKVSQFTKSTEANDQLIAVVLMEEIMEINDESTTSNNLVLFFNLLKNVLNRQNNDLNLIEKTTQVLAKLIKSGGALSSDRNEARRYTAILLFTKFSEIVSTLVFVHIRHFLDLIWVALRDPSETIRTLAVNSLHPCFEVLKLRNMAGLSEIYNSLYQEALKSFRQNIIEYVHGSLLVIRELLTCSDRFMESHLEEICTIIFRFKTSKAKIIRETIVDLIPQLARFSPHFFQERYLDSIMTYLYTVYKRDSVLKNKIFETIGELALIFQSNIEKHIPEIMKRIQLSMAPNKKKTYCELSMSCLSKVAKFSDIRGYLNSFKIIDTMIESPLNQTKINSLFELTSSIPDIEMEIKFKLLNLLSFILTSKPYKMPSFLYIEKLKIGLSNDFKQQDAYQTNPQSKMEQILLAFKTFRKFRFGELLRPKFIYRGIVSFFQDENPKLRLKSAKTCIDLICENQISGEKEIHFIFNKLLSLGITDSEGYIRQKILSKLATKLRTHLAQSENVQYLMLALYDEVFQIRKLVIVTLSQLAEHNPAEVIPTLRTTLISLLTEFEYSQEFAVKERSIHLIVEIAKISKKLIYPYCDAILQVFIPKLHENSKSVNSLIIEHLLSAIGSIVVIGGEQMKKYVDELLPLIIETFQKQGVQTRYITLQTLAQLIQSTGSVIDPYKKFPRFLPMLLKTIKTENHLGIRREAIKVIGMIGALDPYKFKMNQTNLQFTGTNMEKAEMMNMPGMDNKEQTMQMQSGITNTNTTTSMSRKTTGEIGFEGISKPNDSKINTNMQTIQTSTNTWNDNSVNAIIQVATISGDVNEEKAPKQTGEDADFQDTNEMTRYFADIANNNLDEFYAKVSISALMKIISDSSLGNHHEVAAQSLLRIINYLGEGSIPFLRQILAPFFEAVQKSDSISKEFLFQQFTQLVLHLRQHISPHLEEIVKFIFGNWQTAYLAQILELIEKLVQVFPDEVTTFLPVLVPLLIGVLRDDRSEHRDHVLRTLQCVEILAPRLGDYLQLVVPVVLEIAEKKRNDPSLCVAAVNAISALSDRQGFADFSSRIVRIFLSLIPNSGEEVRKYVIEGLNIFSGTLGPLFRVFLPGIERIFMFSGISKEEYMRIAEKSVSANKNNEMTLTQKNNRTNTREERMGFGALAFRKIPLNAGNLKHSWQAQNSFTKEDWEEWMRRFSGELVRESPSPAIRSCSDLVQSYHAPARALFNAAFLSCWMDLLDHHKDDLAEQFECAFRSHTIPQDILQTLLNLAEFMEHVQQPLPLSVSVLASIAENCHAFAKALRYRELELGENTTSAIEAIISLSNKLQMPETAIGIIEYAKQAHSIEPKESWFEEMNQIEEALSAYERKQLADPLSLDLMIGRMRCLYSLGEWEKLIQISHEAGNFPEAQMSYTFTTLVADASWMTNNWALMKKCSNSLPERSAQGAFLRAVVDVKFQEFESARKHIDIAREMIIDSISALVGESYSRAYSDIIRAQQLAELEEVIEYMQSDPHPSHRAFIRGVWRRRLKGCERSVDSWLRILAIRSIVIDKRDDVLSWFKFARISERNSRKKLAEKTIRATLRMSREALDPNDIDSQKNPLTSDIDRFEITLDSDHVIRQSNNFDINAKISPSFQKRDSETNTFSFFSQNISNLSTPPQLPISGVRMQTQISELFAENPKAGFQYLHHLWDLGHPKDAFEGLKHFVQHLSALTSDSNIQFSHGRTRIKDSLRTHNLERIRERSNDHKNSRNTNKDQDRNHDHLQDHDPNQDNESEQEVDLRHLSAKVYLQLGKWQLALQTPQQDGRVDEETALNVLDVYRKAMNSDPSWAKAWHAWALLNFEIVSRFEADKRTLSSQDIHTYLLPAISGFFRAIHLSSASKSIRDTLRLLTLWFRYGSYSKVISALKNGFSMVSITIWLQVIPQLIARINSTSRPIKQLIHNLLIQIGKAHPQALVYSLTVAEKFQEYEARLSYDKGIRSQDSEPSLDRSLRHDSSFSPNNKLVDSDDSDDSDISQESRSPTDSLLKSSHSRNLSDFDSDDDDDDNDNDYSIDNESTNTNESYTSNDLDSNEQEKNSSVDQNDSDQEDTDFEDSDEDEDEYENENDENDRNDDNFRQQIPRSKNQLKLSQHYHKMKKSTNQKKKKKKHSTPKIQKQGGLVRSKPQNFSKFTKTKKQTKKNHKTKHKKNVRSPFRSTHNVREDLSDAGKIMESIKRHSPNLAEQAKLVSNELIRVAILWEEKWYESLDDASKIYFSEPKNFRGMMAILRPLHDELKKGGETAHENKFLQLYRTELDLALKNCEEFARTQNQVLINRAWESYYRAFRRFAREIPTIRLLDLKQVSPRLLEAKHLELAVPGTYNINSHIVRIDSFVEKISVLKTKQRPRKLKIRGSDGSSYQFLLKGHEDLRQDERVMQLFGLVNALLSNSFQTSRLHLGIQRYAVVPLSPNTGLIGWVPHCDTLHDLIRDYRESHNIVLNLEHQLMTQMAPDYDKLALIQKIEVFGHSLQNTDGLDLNRILWLKSQNSEVWLDKRTNYTRSLAVMSMVGYILGLGDRHPSNIMMNKFSGKITHIDFGDCFEVAMIRQQYPEKIPFRLTRMLVKAMEMSGIEGTFKETCKHVMTILRKNKDSLMAMLEAFVYDPLFSWLFEQSLKFGTDTKKPIRTESEKSSFDRTFSNFNLSTTEAPNQKALDIIDRISNKLNGRDFRKDTRLDPQKQIELLIQQATSHENLCQCYIGWCPFW